MAEQTSSQRMFLVSVSGIPGYFDTKSGGETSADTNKHYNGGSNKPEILSGPAEVDNLTVSRAWKYTRDFASHKAARARVGTWDTVIAVTPTDGDLVAIGEPVTYTGRLVRVSEPEYDSGSSDPATFELEFAVDSVI